MDCMYYAKISIIKYLISIKDDLKCFQISQFLTYSVAIGYK
jgi:hypothetical protein